MVVATCCRDFTDAAWLDLLDDPALRDDLARLIPQRPDSVDAPGWQGDFHSLTRDRLQAPSRRAYSNAVFAATLLVQQGGTVEMLDDEPLVSDLPFKQRSKLG